MKPYFPLFLCTVSASSVASSARAQPPVLAPPPPQNENDAIWNRALQAQREEFYGSKKAVPESGFFYLLRAAEALDENPAPAPQPENNLAPTIQLNYDRAIVGYYQEPLRLLRIALQKEIVRPEIEGKPLQTSADNPGDHNYDANFRQLSRILVSESNLRLAAGDAQGALDSRLTGMELGVAVTRGAPLIGVLTGNAIDTAQRQNFGVVAAKLDAAQLRGALKRLRALNARRATYAETCQAEKAISTALLLAQFQGLFDPQARKALDAPEAPEARAQAGITDEQWREALALTPQTLRQSIDGLYVNAITNAELPFQKAKLAPAPVITPNFVTALVANFASSPNYRFSFERQIAQSRLFEAALELRAIKLETGSYPPEFDAGIDPFSLPLQPFIYSRDGDKYQLYSVGPDGQDDGGAPLYTVVTDKKSGIKTMTTGSNADSTGDFLAPIF